MSPAETAGVAVTDDSKAIQGLIARAALKGWELHRLSDSTFVIRQFGIFRMLDSLAAAERFVARAEGHGS